MAGSVHLKLAIFMILDKEIRILSGQLSEWHYDTQQFVWIEQSTVEQEAQNWN